MSVACPQCSRTVPDDRPLCFICGARLRPPVPCRSCGREISDGIAACPFCYAPTSATPAAPPPAAQLPRFAGAPPDFEKFRIEIRAKIMWGEDHNQIRLEYAKQGYPSRTIDDALAAALAERDAHYRSLGRRDLLIAGGCLVGFLAVAGIFSVAGEARRVNVRGIGALYLAMCALPAAAIYFLMRGLRRLTRGGKGEGAATDVEEGD